MYKVSLLVILILLFCISINYNYPNFIENKETSTRVTLLLSLFSGLYITYYLNRKEIRKNFKVKRKINLNRIKLKFLTFLIIWVMCIAFSVCMAYFFDEGLYYYFYLDSFLFSPFILIIFLWWICFMDVRQGNQNDNYYTLMLDINNKNFKWEKYKVFLLNILVKIFYIPFMYGAVFVAISQILSYQNILMSGLEFISLIFLLGLCFDCCVGLGGYLFSSKFFNTETISVDSSLTGWLVCIICYPPFVIFLKQLLEQSDSYIWSDWLQSNEILYWVWAFLICLTWGCYWLATVSFGFRFSNLSWRGLVNTGLYRYMRHPAYVFKNIYWWIYTVPWFGVLGWDMLRNVLALSCISFIYYLRAKTEERHLSQFEEYIQYLKWIDENGLYAKIKKIIKIS